MPLNLHPSAQNTLFYSVVVPAHDEEQTIGNTVRALTKALRAAGMSFEVVVVNDNSTDNTAQSIEALCRAIAEVRLVHNTPPNGLGRAIRCGLEHFRGDAVAIVMADSSDRPEDVVACYRKLEEGYDCVFGSRFLPGSRVTDYPPLKFACNRLGNRLIQVLFRTRHNDLTNAFKVYRRHVIEGIGPLRADHFDITIELSLSALVRGYTIATVPISWSGRTWGQSKLRLHRMARRYLGTLWRIWRAS